MEKKINNFGRIGVLMGGPSSEREVSLKSGTAVYGSLKNQDLDAVAIDIKTADRQQNCELIRQMSIDIAFIALHGHFGEDGQIQDLLEELEIPYTGSGPAASRLAMDKIASRKIFQKQGLPVPNYIIFTIKDCQDLPGQVTSVLNQPFVVKPAAQGSSIGLSIVRTEEELQEAAEIAFKFDERIIVEEYIPGREITVGILGDSALPIVEIIPQNKFYDYEAKYTPGKSEYVVPACLSAQVTAVSQRVALRAHQALGCFGFSRVDMRLSLADTPFILEVNSIPGLTETSLLPKAAKARGINFDRLCFNILRLACQRSLENNRIAKLT